MTRRTLVLGGVRSGKSRLAERLAHESALPVTYVATAMAQDEEMRRRIAAHQARRPADWTLVEEPLALAEVIARESAADRCILVECLTLWLTNLLMREDEPRLRAEMEALTQAVAGVRGRLILVGNETNMGIIPLGELSRRFCDLAGALHQRLASECEQVLLCVAGLPLAVKGELP